MKDCFQADWVMRWARTVLTRPPESPSIAKVIGLCETGCSKQ